MLQAFYLYLYFVDGHVERKLCRCFSDLSQSKSKFYYWETPSDSPGRGSSVLRSDLICFEVTPYRVARLDEMVLDNKK